jgi:hypothetical protein
MKFKVRSAKNAIVFALRTLYFFAEILSDIFVSKQSGPVKKLYSPFPVVDIIVTCVIPAWRRVMLCGFGVYQGAFCDSLEVARLPKEDE